MAGLWEKYVRAHSVEEALLALTTSPQPACPISGGTDLLLDLQQGRHEPVRTLVDLTEIPELTTLETRGGELFLGAAVPLNRVAASELVELHASALREAADLIGGPQVRNTATLGGNVAHALPAADGTIALLALEAQVEVASLAGRRIVPVESLFRGPGRSALDLSRELIVGFLIHRRKIEQASAFKRVMRAQGVALPILNVAARISREGQQISQISFAIGPSGQVPFRARNTEAFLTGKHPESAVLAEATAVLLTEAHFRSSPQRASADYRRELAGWLLNQCLTTAWERTFTEHPVLDQPVA
jgi:CO/xanthine dehydrogenase FAD-binding subunit